MKKSLWILLAVVVGILDAFFVRAFGVEGFGISLVGIAMASAFLCGEYNAAAAFAVGGSVFLSLLTSRSIGWLSLFSIMALVMIGLIRYFIAITDKWLDWVMAVILLVLFYFCDLLVSRGFTFSGSAFMQMLSFKSVFWWLAGNAFGLILMRYIFMRLARWINEE